MISRKLAAVFFASQSCILLFMTPAFAAPRCAGVVDRPRQLYRDDLGNLRERPIFTPTSADTRYISSMPTFSSEETFVTPIAKSTETTMSTEPLPTTWKSPRSFEDLSVFSVTHYAAAKSNIAIVTGTAYSPPSPTATGIARSKTSADTSRQKEDDDLSVPMLQLIYPSGSVNPANRPQGGAEFYAAPLDISQASNVTLEYAVYFPEDFDWVKGGKLPGLFGGHESCSGGDDALDCFSTRLMWRAKGAGELYLVSTFDNNSVPHSAALP
jgi:hypothetical protein